jgi:PREDICTED: similar to CG3770-PA
MHLILFTQTGLFYLLGLILYPAGWGGDAVGYICGPTNEPFWFGECKIGK